MSMLSVKAQRGFSLWAVIASFLVTFVVGLIGAITIHASLGDEVYAVDPMQWRIDHEEANRGVEPPVSNKYVWMMLGLSAVLGVLGGYVAGRIGSDAPIFHAFIVALAMLVFAILVSRSGAPDPMPKWANALGYIATIPLILLGGWMAAQD